MSSDHAALSRFLSEDCTECGTPGPQRHLSAVGGCATCAAADPRPVNVPVRGVYTFDGPLGFPPDTLVTFDAGPFPERPAFRWTPFRNVFSRWHSGKVCYTLPSGNMVHVKPECRCPR